MRWMVAPPLALVNPVASGGRAAGLWRRIEPRVRAHWPEVTVRETGGPGDAERIAREWSGTPGAGPLLVVGGDGTLHEAVNGLLAGPSPPALAVIPAGTGNDFARNTGVPLGAEAALARLGGGETVPRRVDVGRVRFHQPDGTTRSRLFLNSTSAGVSARANRIAWAMRQVLPGRLRYAFAGAVALFAEGHARFEVACDGERVFEGEALNITIANCASFGGGMRISPESSPMDGVLDLVIMGRMGVIRALTALSRLYSGGHAGMRGVSLAPARSPIRLVRADGRPMRVEADGHDFVAAGEITVEVLPGALTLLG